LYALLPKNAMRLASAGNLWQAIWMGNKDARNREKKKPKQEKVKRGNFVPPAPRVIREAPKER